MTESPQKKLWWSVPAAIVLLLATLAIFFGERPESNQAATSHSAAPRGFRAAYLLLDELDIPVRRSRQATEGGIRWALHPTAPKEEDIALLRHWVERGGILLLATDSPSFARGLGLEIVARRAGIEDPGATIVEGRGPGTVLLERNGKTMATRYDRGSGEIWLLHRPEMVRNDEIGKGDNGIVLVRLAEQALAEAANRNERRPMIYFDEFYHGLRDRPGVVAILFTPPMHWFTLAALLFLGLLLWHAVPRFGAIQPPPPATRRSKEEFLDAVAGLLARNRDYRDAYQTARAALIRDVEIEIGVAAGVPIAQVLHELRQRPGGERLASFLGTAVAPDSPAALVATLNHLEHARNEFWHGRNHS